MMMGKTRISPDDIDPLVQLRVLYREYFERKHVMDNPDQLIDEMLADEEELENQWNKYYYYYY